MRRVIRDHLLHVFLCISGICQALLKAFLFTLSLAGMLFFLTFVWLLFLKASAYLREAFSDDSFKHSSRITLYCLTLRLLLFLALAPSRTFAFSPSLCARVYVHICTLAFVCWFSSPLDCKLEEGQGCCYLSRKEPSLQGPYSVTGENVKIITIQ